MHVLLPSDHSNEPAGASHRGFSLFLRGLIFVVRIYLHEGSATYIHFRLNSSASESRSCGACRSKGLSRVLQPAEGERRELSLPTCSLTPTCISTHTHHVCTRIRNWNHASWIPDCFGFFLTLFLLIVLEMEGRTLSAGDKLSPTEPRPQSPLW